MASSGSTKPLTIVGTPRSASTASSGRVPPRRTNAGGVPHARSIASAATRSAGCSASNSAGSASSMSIVTSAPGGAAARIRRSSSAPISAALWPGASRRLTCPRARAGTIVRGSPTVIMFTSSAGAAPVRS